MVLKALIVDDEYPAREELRYLLGQFHDIEIVGEAADSNEALKMIQALDYDVLFLDIKLPGISGLELAEKIQALPKKPQIIFITAYDNYALNAFGLDAVDYILKPINKLRLKRVIGKLKKTDTHHDPVTQEELAANRIIAELNGKMILIDLDEVFYIFSEGDMVLIKIFQEKLFTRFTLKELEERLPKAVFFRTHRSYIVNINKVKEIDPFFNGTYNLILGDKERSEVPVSRNQAKKLRRILGYL